MQEYDDVEQYVAPSAEVKPGAQAVQSESDLPPIAVRYFPTGQDVHDDEELEVDYVPGGHCAHPPEAAV